MLDSIEIQQGDKNNINSFSAINQLKQNLKQDTSPNEFKENKKSNNENNPQSPNLLISNDNKNLSQSERIKPKNSKSYQKNKIINGKAKNSYSNFIRNIRATTPVLNNLSNSNLNSNKNRIKPTSSFSRTLNNFFQKNKLLINDDDDKSSIINDDPIKLRNQFQHYLGKANEKTTKEVSFQKLKEIITNNHSTENLRVYISCLSTYSRNATIFGMEIFALLYGYISGVYKENLMDPIDNPPNIIKTINRILGHLRQIYLGSNSYMVHKSSSRSICDIYDNCMPKDNIKSIYMIFFEPLFEILSNGTEKSTQEGAAICLMDLIYHLGENRKKNNINKKILDTIDEKIISLCTKSSSDNPYLFEALYNLISFNKIEKFSNYLKEIYDRFIVILCKTNKNKYNYLMKLNALKILNLIGSKIRNIADISIGYYQEEILKVIEFNTKDKNTKVQLQAKKTLKTWKELKKIYEDIDTKKREIKDDITKDDFINNNLINKKLSGNNEEEEEEEEENETLNENVINGKNNGFSTVVRKMDKLNFLRNLAKRAKIENQKIDYDSQLPEKMKEEVYKKGITNILNFSKFLKHRLLTKESAEFQKDEVSPKNRKLNRNKMKNEIKDYLKHSKQVKKYDSIKKMEHDNIISKDKSNNNINIENLENNNDNIIKEENESNFNINDNNNINDNINDNIDDNINNINIDNENNNNRDNNKNNINIDNENNNNRDNNKNNNRNNYINKNNNRNNYINKNNNRNNNKNNNFVEESPIQGQNFGQNETNMNYNEENNNQEEINQDDNNQNQIENEDENENENDIEQNNKEEENNNNINIIQQNNNNFNNSQISDTKNSFENKNIKQVNENTNNFKNNLQNIFNDIIYKSFDEFEKNITIKLNQMNNRINDISLRINDYQNNQFNLNEGNEGGFSKTRNLGDKTYSQSSYRPQSFIENNNSFYINSKKMRLNSIKDTKNISVNTEEQDFYINNNLTKRESTNIDSEVTKTWKETLKLIEKGKINEGYLKLINSGDDIYLLRLICLTGPIIDKLDIDVAKRVLLRVNMISKSHQIQQLLIGLIKSSIKNNIFKTLEPNQQNYILDSLYEFSGLNNSLATEAAELYAELTK